MAVKRPLAEEANLEPPRYRDVHTEEECDVMLALPLAPKVRDAWLDERLSCMRALALTEVEREQQQAETRRLQEQQSR